MLSVSALARTLLERAGFAIHRIKTDDTDVYRRLYPPDSIAHKRFYNVGSGGFFHPLWTNLDYVTDHYASVQKAVVPYNLMEDGPLPIEDGTAEIIYTEHTVEHVTDEAVARLFRNAYAALKPGGILRVTTGPDADTDFRALMDGDERWFYWETDPNLAVNERWLHHVASQLTRHNPAPSDTKLAPAEIDELVKRKGFPDALDHLTGMCTFQAEFPGNHISWWNAAKLERFMREAGFQTVYRSGYGQSRAHVLRNTHYFDNTHPQISVYVEAVR